MSLSSPNAEIAMKGIRSSGTESPVHSAGNARTERETLPSVQPLPVNPAPPPPSHPSLRMVLLICFVALTLGLGVLSLRQRTYEFSAYLNARTTYITAERGGRLIKFDAHEGDRVDLGTALAQMSDEELSGKLVSKMQEVRTLEAELQQKLAQADLDSRTRLKSIHESLAQYRLMEASYLKDKYNYEVRRNMLIEWNNNGAHERDSAVNPLFMPVGGNVAEELRTAFSLEAVENNTDVCSAQIEICHNVVKRLVASQENLEDTVRRSSGVAVVEARLDAVRKELTSLETAQDRLTVRSTAVATVGLFRAKPGDRLEAGDPIVDLLDDAQRYLIVEVPSGKTQMFPVNRELKLRFPGDVMRRGRVVRMAPQAERRGINDVIVFVHVEQTGDVWPHIPIGSEVAVEPFAIGR